MLPGKLLITGVLVSFIAVGCVQKKPQSRKIPSQTKTVSKPVLKDTTDIFDEFYKNESVGTTGKTISETGSKSETFSTKPSKKSVSSEKNVENGKYVLQVSTVKSKNLADQIASKLEKKGFPAYVAQVQDPTPKLAGTYYRIRIGGFTTITSARNYGESSVKSAGYDFWIDKKANDNVGSEGYGLGSAGSSYDRNQSESYRKSSTGSSGNTQKTEAQFSNHSSSDASNGNAISTPVKNSSPAPSPKSNPVETPGLVPEPNSKPVETPVPIAPAPSAAPSTGIPTSKGSQNAIPDTTGWGSAW